MGRGEDERKVGWGLERPEEDEAPPPPEHGGPIWLNPRFVFPIVGLVALAIALSIVLRDDPPDRDPGQASPLTTTTTVVTTTLAPVTTTTTTRVPRPRGLDDLGGEIGLGPDDLDALAAAMIPYDGTWYPGPDGALIDPRPPGLDSVGVARVRPAGVDSFFDVFIAVFDGEPRFEDPPGAFTQIGVGIACEEPERTGLDGLGGTGWSQRHFFGVNGYSGHDDGFGYHSGSTVAIVVPAQDECPYAAIANFFRDMVGDAPAATDPADHQWVMLPLAER